MEKYGLLQETPHDPLVPAEKGQPHERSCPPEPGERSHREATATGEHPAVRTTSLDDNHLAAMRSGYENTSAPQHDHEPEDQLPDHLDKYR